MREITEIIIHHAAVHQHDMSKILPSFDFNHQQRLTEKYNQPSGGGEYPNIAYHYIITPTGSTEVRDLNVLGYHASNLAANARSIAICLSGNLDNETPTVSQLEMLEKLVIVLKKQFPAIEKVSGHRLYAKKTCPGKHFTDEMILHFHELINGSVEPKYTKENIDFPHRKIGSVFYTLEEQNKSPWWAEEMELIRADGISNGERPHDPITRAEVATMINRSNHPERRKKFGFFED